MGRGRCKKGWVELDFTGAVTGGTSVYTHVGDPVSYDVCFTFKSGTNVTLVKGTKVSF